MEMDPQLKGEKIAQSSIFAKIQNEMCKMLYRIHTDTVKPALFKLG